MRIFDALLTDKANVKMMRSMSIQKCHQRKSVVMLAWLALVMCLVSASSIHHHDRGIHLAHACQLCALEEVTTHGAAISVSVTPVAEPGIWMQVTAPDQHASGARYFTRDIRGSPLFS